MSLRKSKHSKFKNTGLLFEFLVRQLTVDVLNNSENSKSLKIIKRRFNENTELGKELNLYNILLTQKFKSDKKADFFINEALSNVYKLNKSSLRREKYNLIKELRENYDLSNLLSSRINNYKLYASIYKLFEDIKLSPEEKTESYFTILEHVTSNSVSNKTNLSSLAKYNKILNENGDVRILSYKILLEKFNKKYKSLNESQKNLLKAYISNISNVNSLKEYINNEIPSLKKELLKYSNGVDNNVVKIKLKEAINSINKFCKLDSKALNVNDDVVVQTMRYYELLKELKK